MSRIFTRTNTSTVKATIQIYRDAMQSDRRNFWIGVICIPTGHLLYTVLLPLFLSLILQSLIVNPNDMTTPLWLAGAMAVASILTVIANNKGFPTLFHHEERMTTRLTERAMNTLLSHSHNFFANTKVGSLAGDVTGFARSYLAILDTVFLQASPIVINFVASLIIIAILSPVLLVPLGLLTSFVVWHSIRSMNRRAVYRNKRKKMTSHLNGTIADVMGNQLLVRVFARGHEEVKQVVTERTAIEHVVAKEIAVIQYESNIRQAVLFAVQILTIMICAWLYTRDLVSIAALVFAITYLGRITSSLFNTTQIFRSIEQAFLDAAPITSILSRSHEVQDVPDAAELVVNKGRVSFENVSFKYGDAENEAVFDRLSLDILPAQKIGLAGPSGGGKTTFTQLLLRFADAQSGRILIDGQDISRVTQQSLRAHIAYVPQEPFLFHRSLRENIAYGRPDATDEEVMEAAREAYAMEFIEKLPLGLDTIVGERGVKFSGGQRQRIAIARAILKDAPILILDEATSALDSESEHMIQSSLDKLMVGRTTIVIAHRLSTIAKLDRIIVLENGEITEDGTHRDLIKQAGTYAKLWSHQSGGFIEE